MNNDITSLNIACNDVYVVDGCSDNIQKLSYDFNTDNYRLAQAYVFQLLETIRDHRVDITFTCDNNNINFVCTIFIGKNYIPIKIDNEYLTHNAVKYPWSTLRQNPNGIFDFINTIHKEIKMFYLLL